MILNRIYIYILTIWKHIISFYDNSSVGTFISRLCVFFEKKCHQSSFLGYFRDKFSGTRYLKESILGKAIGLPFNLLRAFYTRFSAKIEDIKSKSLVLSFLNSFEHISVRSLGLVVAPFGFACALCSLILPSASFLSVALGLFLAFCGVIMLAVNASVKNTFYNSFLVKLFLDILFLESAEYDYKIYVIRRKKLACILSFAFGVLSAIIGLPAVLLAVAASFVVILIMRKTIAGIYIIVATCAVLPTMALIGLVCLTLISYAVHLAFGKNATYRITPFSLPIAVFVFLSSFAAFTSITLKGSVMTLLVYLVFTFSFTLIANTVKTKKNWQSLVAVFALSSFVVALYGVMQNFFLEQTTQSWVDSEMFEDIKIRVYSTLDNPNVLGQFLMLSIPISIACFFKSGSFVSKAVYALGIFVSAACLFFTWSRAAWVGVFLAVVIMLIKKDRRFLALCVVGVFLLPAILPQSIMARLTSIGNTGDSSTSYRISVWTASFYMIKDFFFTGVGLGSDAFAHMYRNYALGGASFALHAHNFYLQWIADMGIGGLLVYIVIILTAYKCISSVGKGKSLMNLTCYAIAGSLVGYLFQGIAETMWYNYHMILIFWIIISFAHTASHISQSDKMGADASD